MNPELDKKAIRKSFNRVAKSYDNNAILQCRVGEALHAKIARHSLRSSQILDIGCGTGFLSAKLVEKCKRLLALDIALPMLHKTRSKLPITSNTNYLCADAEAIPLQNNSMDCIVSNLSLQWCQNLEQIFTEFRRILSANGKILFSTFGIGTLSELKSAWDEIDDYPHINFFFSEAEIYRALTKAGFSHTWIEVESVIVKYTNVFDLMWELKNIGAHNVNRERFKALTGKNRLHKMLQVYEKFRHLGLIPATFEIIYVVADLRTK